MKKRNQAITILGGIGAGAALMYFLDPDRGTRRRALVRDKAVGVTNDVKQNVTGYSKHLKNRATGMYYEARSFIGKNAENLSETVSENAGQLKSAATDAAEKAADTVSDKTSSNPFGNQARSFGSSN